MQYTNKVLEKMEKKRSYNKKYSDFFYRWSLEEKALSKNNSLETIGSLNLARRLQRKADRIYNCMNLWQWDLYEKNKLMDLKRVNRCNNNRVCPNCKKLDLAKAIHKFNPIFNDLITKQGYYPYLATFTIPNCSASELKSTIKKLFKDFYKFYLGFSSNDNRAIKFRNLHFVAGLRVLEITYNKENDTYHPHLHCILFSDTSYNELDFKKDILGFYSSKRKTYNKHSLNDINISKVWTLINQGDRLSKKNYDSLSSDPRDLLQCDIRELDERGILEVLKYTFKDTDIANYEVFKIILSAIENLRLRQGYGELYNISFEDVDVGELQNISDFLIEKENPSDLLTREIRELVTTYKNYTKISRFVPNTFNDIID